MRSSIVVVTTGVRPASFGALIETLGDLDPPPSELVVVWNGTEPQLLNSKVTIVAHHNPVNEGVPAARNVGCALASGDIVVFLDDDALPATSDMLARLGEEFESSQELAVIGFRIEDPDTGQALGRWLPRPRSSIANGGPATRFPGGAFAVRKDFFDKAGGFPALFFFGHEETDLAWRLIDLGYEISYEPRIVVNHPTDQSGRPVEKVRLGCRNRVWLARRRLPWLLRPVYLTTWFVVSLLRAQGSKEIKAVLSGFAAGFREDAGGRAPMSWKTVAHLARLGHPPVF